MAAGSKKEDDFSLEKAYSLALAGDSSKEKYLKNIPIVMAETQFLT
ncbi:MAG: hypothetical protein P8O99_02305 [Pseudomonadales bacterium]|nr:hypothetical protein [Pseudomonadales bacterium]